MPYVLSHGVSPHGTDWINESAAECYLPLLDGLRRLEALGIKPKWTVNISPILLEQLADPNFQADFEQYCQDKVESAIQDGQRFVAENDLRMVGLAAFWKNHFETVLYQFVTTWNRSIPQAFRHFQDIGSIEVITCGATHGYLPLLATDESVAAQVELGARTYEKHFGCRPKGIWLPECAYRPSYSWTAPAGDDRTPFERIGVEEVLQLAQLEYFFVDSHMIRGGQPLGTYAGKFPQLAELFARSMKMFSPPEEFRSEYEHYALHNGVVCMARDPETTVKVWSGDHGYPGDPYYLEFHKQLYPGRHRYWRISEDKRDLGKKQPYEPWSAFEHIGWHARDMVETLTSTLARYRGMSDRAGTVIAMYDTELFGHWWFEGPEFLVELATLLHGNKDIEVVTGSELLVEDPPRHQITLPEGSWGEGGYHYVWLNEGNHWTWEKLYPLERRFAALVREPKRDLAERVLKQAARELLLAESSDWQFLISTYSARDYAEIRFDDHIDRLTKLCDMAVSMMGGASLSEKEWEFVSECEQKDACFAEIDLDLWVRPFGTTGPELAIQSS